MFGGKARNLEWGTWGHIFNHVRPFYEQALSNLDP